MSVIMYDLPDVQQSVEGFYKIPINKVGVRNITIPFKVIRRDSSICNTIAKVSSYCDLIADSKGINMSRISRTLFSYIESVDYVNTEELALKLKDAHQSNDVYVKCSFPYIFRTLTPITAIDSYETVDVILQTKYYNNKFRHYLTVESTEMSLCPCSKEMSLLTNNLSESERSWLDKYMKKDYSVPESLVEKLNVAGFGAHNQKSRIKVTVEYDMEAMVYIEDLVKIIQQSGSCETYSTLKRPDEKYVTEVSYMGSYIDENKDMIKVGKNRGAKFVEDIARDVVKNILKFNADKVENTKKGTPLGGILDYVVVVNNQESIHSMEIEATAVLSAGKELR